MSNEQFPDNAPSAFTPKQKKILAIAVGSALVIGFVGLNLMTGKKSKKVVPVSETKSTKPKTEDFEQAVQPTHLKDPNEPTQNSEVNPLAKVLDRDKAPEKLGVNTSEEQSSSQEQRNAKSKSGHPGNIHEGAPSPEISEPYQLAKSIEDRIGDPYQRMVTHFKQKEPKTWQMDASALKNVSTMNIAAEVDPSLQHLVEGGIKGAGMSYTIPSGTRIIAITDQKVSTDHPGFFSASVVRPFLLKGAKLICQSGANTNDRIPAQPIKIVLRDSLEIALQGQVQTDFPGVDGDVTTHYMKRMGPAITNAAIGGAFAAWALSRPNSGTNIDTRDAIVAPIVQSSVEGVQNEITRLGGDYPNTVEIPAGKQFQIMLTDAITFKK